jgi:hypothetical protein
LRGFTGQLARFWPGLSFVDDSAQVKRDRCG